MGGGDTFFYKNGIKHFVDAKNSSNSPLEIGLDDIAKLVLFKYYSFSNFSKKLNLTRGRISQILKGYHIPEDPKIIRQWAELLYIDPIILSQVFENAKNKGDEDGKR